MGRVPCILAQMWENGALKAPDNFFSPAEGGTVFLYPCVDTQNAQIFVENSNVGDKHENKDPRSSHQAGGAHGEGTCCIAELTHNLVPPLCEDGG